MDCALCKNRITQKGNVTEPQAWNRKGEEWLKRVDITATALLQRLIKPGN